MGTSFQEWREQILIRMIVFPSRGSAFLANATSGVLMESICQECELYQFHEAGPVASVKLDRCQIRLQITCKEFARSNQLHDSMASNLDLNFNFLALLLSCALSCVNARLYPTLF